MAYCILKIKKIKTYSSMETEYSHFVNLSQVWQEDRKVEYFDSYGVQPSSPEIVTAWRKHFSTLSYYNRYKLRPDAVLAYCIRMGYSKEAAPWIDESLWKSCVLEWLQKTFEFEHILSLVYHFYTEGENKVYHAHAIVVPVDEKGQLNASHYTWKKQHLSHLQDTFAESMAPCGLKRGLKYNTGDQDPPVNYYAEATSPVYGIAFPGREDCASDEEYADGIVKAWKIERAAHEREKDIRKRKLLEAQRDTRSDDEIQGLIVKKSTQILNKKKQRSEYASAFGGMENLKVLAKTKRALETALSEHPDKELCMETLALIDEVTSWHFAS